MVKTNNRGQMKIQQMAFMLMGITLFFVLVGMFFLVVYFSDIQDSAGILEEKNALLLVTKLANSPEFACGEAFGNQKTNCVDADKAMILKKNINNYEDLWSVDNIIIRKLYPTEEEVECNVRNYPNCNVISLKEGSVSSTQSNFVSLCRKESDDGEVYDKCELAKLIVSYGGENV